jgi:Zn-finger nucleic acid-binding protein
MNCPRCSEQLDEKDREGITIDVCRGCRGVWLDRGELEKLIARATKEIDERPQPRSQEYRQGYDRDDGPPSSDDYRRKHGRKRSWLDIFD